MGFSYDFYITQEQYESLSESTRESVLLHCLVLSDEQIETYGDLLSPMTNIYSLSWDENQYKTDCKDRARTSCSSFAYTTSGFTAVSSGDKERLVFFSVPYESGWSATVNGEPVQVEQVSVGFMAVKVPAGESTIVFTYETPGLKIGAFISLISVLLLALYLLCARFFRRRQVPVASRSPFTPRPFSHFTGLHQDAHFNPKHPILVKPEEDPLEKEEES